MSKNSTFVDMIYGGVGVFDMFKLLNSLLIYNVSISVDFVDI